MAAVVMHHFSVLAAPSVRSQGTVLGGVFNMPFFIVFSFGQSIYIKAGNFYIPGADFF